MATQLTVGTLNYKMNIPFFSPPSFKFHTIRKRKRRRRKEEEGGRKRREHHKEHQQEKQRRFIQSRSQALFSFLAEVVR